MTSDYRTSSDFIHNIVDALERHGYARSDDLHAGHAIGLTGDLAHIYEGTQDAPPSGYVVVPSSQPTAPQPPGPPGQDAVIVSADQVRTLLAALDDAAEYKARPDQDVRRLHRPVLPHLPVAPAGRRGLRPDSRADDPSR